MAIPHNTSQSHGSKREKFIAQFCAAVTSHMEHGKVSLEAIAQEFYITRGQLNRRIKAELGITAQQLSLQVRMNHAKQLLLTNDELTVADVAFQCGFEDATSFSRAFHRAFAMSPTEFRNNQIE